ncbi:MAG: hypothetical protein OHK0012_21510 [Synechococcales cyanobacterium]
MGQPHRQRPRSLGFTLLEVLAALAIVSIGLAALAPSIAVAVLGRLQSQRIEVATQLAQAELDRYRNVLDQGPLPFTGTPAPPTAVPSFPTPTPTPTIGLPTPTVIPSPGFRGYNVGLPYMPDNGVPPTPGNSMVANFANAYANIPPPGFRNTAATQTYTDGLVGDPTVKCFPWTDPTYASCHDFASKDYVIQVFRDVGVSCCVRNNGNNGNPIDGTRDPFCQGVNPAVRARQIDDADGNPGSGTDLLRPCAFNMTVRVYHRSAFTSAGFPNANLGRDPARAFVNSSINRSVAEAPLAVLSAQLASGGSNLRQLCTLINNGATNCPQPGALGTPSPSPSASP